MAQAQTLVLKKAQRSKAWLKLGVSGPSGAGKTLSSLLLGYGLVKEKHPTFVEEDIWDKIAIVDTENGSGELYTGTSYHGLKIGQYLSVTLQAPFEAQKYKDAIDLCEDAGVEVVIIDSGTHLWSGEGGLLEQQANAAKRTGNSYTAWRDITPQHTRFVEKILQCPMHVILTLRAKQEYVQEKNEESGRSVVRKLGLEPEARKGLEYEFTIFLEINADHQAFGSKDRTGLVDGKTFVITPKIGRDIMKWLDSGVDTPSEVVKTKEGAGNSVGSENPEQELKDDILAICKKYGSSNAEMMAIVYRFTGKYSKDINNPSANPNVIKDMDDLTKLKAELEAFDKKQN